MRTTKALLLAAAVGAVGIASSMAQTVYSVNVVGFVNLSLTNSGFNLIANPLKATNDNLTTILPTVPEGSYVAFWDATNQMFASTVYTYVFGSWDGDTTVQPGQAFFINMSEPGTLTFVGEVRQGTLSTPMVAGANFVGSQVPQQGAITGVLGFNPDDGDYAAKWDPIAQKYFDTVSTFVFGSWDLEPELAIGEGIVVTKGASGAWSRTFNVNP